MPSGPRSGRHAAESSVKLPRWRFAEGSASDRSGATDSAGVIGWARANLFNGWFNSLLTLVTLFFFYKTLPPFVRWAFIDSNWIYKPPSYGIFLNYGRNTTISNNQIDSTSSNAIYCQYLYERTAASLSRTM